MILSLAGARLSRPHSNGGRRRSAFLGLLALLAAAPIGAQEGDQAVPSLVPAEGFVVFFNTRGALSYPTLTPGEVPAGATPIGAVRGRGCQYGLSIPLGGVRGPRFSGAIGQGGFERALAAMRVEHPGLKGIFDVKVDDHLLSILGIYRRLCTEVLAQGFQ